MNPSVPQAVVDRAIARDPVSAASEYLAEFRPDLEAFVSLEALRACITPGLSERAPLGSVRYVGFVDTSGGGTDSFTLAIAHRKGRVAVLDAVRECKPPFSPERVVAEFAELLRRYRITKVYGDRYGGEWPIESFRNHGITYEASAKSKSELYLQLLSQLNSRAVGLLDVPRLVAQLAGLERRTARGGRDSIDHAPGAHDDLANSAAGALTRVGAGSLSVMDVLGDDPESNRRWRFYNQYPFLLGVR
jgi:hypothetical protein